MNIVYQGKAKTGEDILIRYPEKADVEQLLSFINEISDERTFIRYQGEHETLESETKWLEERLKQIKDGKVVHLLAFYNNRLVGASEINMKDKTEKHIGNFGITVAKDFRSKGLGKLLMELVLREAKKKFPGIKIVTLEVYSANDIARSLYKKFGFVEYGMLPNGVNRGGKFEDAVLMFKNI